MQTGSQRRKGDVNCLLGSSRDTLYRISFWRKDDYIFNVFLYNYESSEGNQIKTLWTFDKKVWFFHDNAPAYGVKLIQALLQSLHWDIFSYPPYSPDLAPSDIHLFPGLKGELGGQRFKTEDELKNAVNTIFQHLDDRWYSAGIEKLVYQFNKCLDRSGDYVEKW